MELKADVIDALNNSTELKALKAAVSASWVDHKRGFPQITVTLIEMRPMSWADDAPFCRELYIQVDVWDKGSPFPAVNGVIAALEAKGHYARIMREMNESDINRVCLRYALYF